MDKSNYYTPEFDGFLSFTIKINGKTSLDNFSIEELTISLKNDSLSKAIIKINISKELESFNIKEYLKLGDVLIIEAGYDNFNSVIFNGVISELGISVYNLKGAVFNIISLSKNNNSFISENDNRPILSLTYGHNIRTCELNSTSEGENILHYGNVQFPGTATINIEDSIKINNLNNSFNGVYKINSLEHVFSEGDWQTTAYIYY